MSSNSSFFRQFLNLFDNQELNYVEEDIRSIVLGEESEEIKFFPKYFSDMNSLISELQSKIQTDSENIFYLHILYFISTLQEFDLSSFSQDLNFCNFLYSFYTSSKTEQIILSLGILFNIFARKPDFIHFLNDVGLFSHLHILFLIHLDEENEKNSFGLLNNKKLFQKTNLAFLRHLTHFICSLDLEIPEIIFHNLWSFAFELVSEKNSPIPEEDHNSIVIETTLAILCNLLSKGYKEELKDEEVHFLSQLLNENSKIIDIFCDFLSLYDNNELISYLINECDLLSVANSALSFNSNEASSIFHFLMTINYSPDVEEPIFQNTISILQNKDTKIQTLIAAIQFSNTFLDKIPFTEINKLIPRPPFLAISNLLDEHDLNTLNSCLDFIRFFVNESQNVAKKTFGFVKLIPALENMYGIDDEIDSKIDYIITNYDQSFVKK